MVNFMYPKDSSARKISSHSCRILHYKLNSDYWIYREETGNDYGRDCILELIEDDYFKNNKIEGQIKGTKKLKLISNNTFVSIPIDTKTVLYALNSSYSFVLFVVDVNTEKIYFQCIQDYFKADKIKMNKLENQEKINIRIPINNCIDSNNDNSLKKLAQKRHCLDLETVNN